MSPYRLWVYPRRRDWSWHERARRGQIGRVLVWAGLMVALLIVLAVAPWPTVMGGF